VVKLRKAILRAQNYRGKPRSRAAGEAIWSSADFNDALNLVDEASAEVHQLKKISTNGSPRWNQNSNHHEPDSI